jgi:hypothetical protein
MRNRHASALAGVLVVLALALTACGGGGTDKNGAKGSPAGDATCAGAAITDAGLPKDFPLPADVTLVKTAPAGPSKIVDGYATDDVEHLYNEWKDILGQVQYTIAFNEVEAPNDAEISYMSADGSSTGQIALRNECGGGGTIWVHITNRPA